MRSYYEMLFSHIQGQSVTPLRRLYGEDFLIDETLSHRHIEDGRPFLCDAASSSCHRGCGGKAAGGDLSLGLVVMCP